jgi:hypothetical protein
MMYLGAVVDISLLIQWTPNYNNKVYSVSLSQRLEVLVKTVVGLEVQAEE